MIIAVPVDFADATLTAEMADDLAAVEAALRDTSFGGDEMFAEVSRHMMAAGGKRFRAMLVLLAARFGDCRDKRIVPAAVAIELTHLATLFHDDVMDEAAIRRGQPSANSQFGNSIAILAGDYLFARASRILADLGPDGDQDPGRDLRPPGRRPAARDGRASRPGRGPAGPLHARDHREDRVADRHLRPVRRDVLRALGGDDAT